MAENPSTWGEAQHVISEALTAANEANRKGMIGYSTSTQIFNALVEAGLLVDDRENLPSEEAWKKFRERISKRTEQKEVPIE
jgi:hypothetical protein